VVITNLTLPRPSECGDEPLSSCWQSECCINIFARRLRLAVGANPWRFGLAWAVGVMIGCFSYVRFCRLVPLVAALSRYNQIALLPLFVNLVRLTRAVNMH